MDKLIYNNQYKSCGEEIENLKRKPLAPQFRLLLSGGPTNPYSNSVAALQLPALSMWEPATRDGINDIKVGLRHILQTNNKYTLALHGTGSTGMSACLDNLLEPGDKIIIGVNGFWPNNLVDMAERYGAEVIRLDKPDGERLTLSEVEAAVVQHRPKVLSLCHGESANGVCQPLDGIGELCHKHGVISLIDVVSTVGSQPIKMDQRKLDVVYMNSQKGIGGIVGLAPVSFSRRAIQVIKSRQTKPRMRQNDIISNAINSWNIEKAPVGYQISPTHSLSMPMLYMLRECLAHFVEEGMENVYNRHAEVHSIFHARAVEELGLDFFVENEDDRLIGTTTFKVPAGKDASKISRYLLQKSGIEISSGLGTSAGRVLRIGLFGANATASKVDKLVEALSDALRSPITDSD